MILIKEAVVKCPTSRFHDQKVDILIDQGIIKEIGTDITSKEECQIIKREDLHISIGWIDTSVSFGEPGFEDRQTLENGLRAAAVGGFTSVGLNPNNEPNPESAAGISFINSATDRYVVDVLPIGNLTLGQEGSHLAELYDMSRAGAVAFYDYKKGISNANLLKIALQYTTTFNGVVQSFPENGELSGSGMINEDETTIHLGLKTKPSMTEEIRIARDLSVLAYTNGRLHIPCVSTAAGLEKIKTARDNGSEVTSSVSINNLVFDTNALEEFDTNYKTHPPLRSSDQRKQLIELVKRGAVQTVTSDHTPLTDEEKEVEFDHASYGSVGLESTFGLLNNQLGIDLSIELLTGGYQVFNLQAPKIEVGENANITLFSTEEEYAFEHKDFVSTAKNIAALGKGAKGKVYGVVNKGKIHLNE